MYIYMYIYIYIYILVGSRQYILTDRLCCPGRFAEFAGSSSCFAASLVLLQGLMVHLQLLCLTLSQGSVCYLDRADACLI